MNNTKRFFRQIIYTEDFNNSTISGLFKTLGKRILADFKVVYDSLEFKLQTILEPESEKDLIFKQNKFPTFSSIIEVLGTRQKNKFYPANPSLWVVFVSCFMGILIIIFVSILHSQDFITVVYKQFGVAIVGSILCITFWVSLFYKEKVYGYHTDLIRNNITLSFWIFLFTEGLCFMSLFWTFFHSLLAASAHIGQFAPGEGIVNYYLDEDVVMHPYWSVFLFTDMTDVKVHNFPDDITNKYTYDHTLAVRFHFNLFDCGQLIDPYGYPALNTALLLISATVLNSGHAKLKMGKYLKSFFFLALTLLLGVIFLCVQFLEIKGCTLQYNDGIYACSFYSLTGLHGIHVILGVFALFLCFINFIKGNYTRKRHDTFWCAVAYWHFVDVVWVLVYLLIYCWPSCLYFSDGVRYSYLGYKDYCFNINTKVFEKSLFEKIVNDDIALSFEIINHYVSHNSTYNEYKKCKSVFSSLNNCNFEAQRQLYNHFLKYIREPQFTFRIPYINREVLEKNDYDGRGFLFQPEFTNECLRKDPYYTEYFNKVEGIENNNNTEMYFFDILRFKRKLLDKELIAFFFNEFNKGLFKNHMFIEKKIGKYRVSNFIYKHNNLNNFPEIDFSLVTDHIINGYKKMEQKRKLAKFTCTLILDIVREENIIRKNISSNKIALAVLGSPSVIDPQMFRFITPEDIKESEAYHNFFVKIFHELSSQESFAIDHKEINTKFLLKHKIWKEIFKCNKNLNRELTSDYPLLKTFYRNKYFHAFLAPKNNLSLEEQILAVSNCYNMYEQNDNLKHSINIPKDWVMNLSEVINLSRHKFEANIEFAAQLSACYLENNRNEENDKLLEKTRKAFRDPTNLCVFDDRRKKMLMTAYYFTLNNLSGQDLASLSGPEIIERMEDYRWIQTRFLNSEQKPYEISKENIAMLYEKYSGLELIKKKHLDAKVEETCGKESFLYKAGIMRTEIDNSDIEDRRRSCLAIIPIDSAPKTLSEVLAKQGRKGLAICNLVHLDINMRNENNSFLADFKNIKNLLNYTLEQQVTFYEDKPYYDVTARILYRKWPSVDHHYAEVAKAISEITGKKETHYPDKELFVYFCSLNDVWMNNDAFYSQQLLEEIEKKRKHLDKINALRKNKIDIHLTYFELYRTRKYMNYSELKNDKHLYAVFLNVLHPLAFDYLDRWAISDFKTWRGKIKFPILFILYHININWAFTFAARFTPYLLTSDFKCIWGDLLYTRKPKWALKKD